MKINAVKGVQDILPPEIEVWQRIEDTARDIFRLFGFQEIRTPIMEYTEVFSRSIGETTDIVEKEMYTFADKADRSLTLRPEGTASVVRAFVEHHLAKVDPVAKFFYGGPMFRYERPQAGRYRQFHQIGVEAFGVADPRLDAEVLQMLHRFLAAIGLRGVEIQVNSIGCPDCRPRFRQAVTDFFAPKLPELCADCQRRFATNPLRILDCKVPRCVEARSKAPSIQDHLDPDCGRHFRDLVGFLETLGVPHRVNPGLVRGLDYYTRTTFEAVAEGLGAQNAVAAGGRYDNLVASFGGPSTPAIGFAVGLERIVLLLRDAHVPTGSPDIFFVSLGEEAQAPSLKLVAGLRDEGFRTELGYNGSLKSQMKRADRLGARWAVLLGDDELGRGTVQVKDLRNREQHDVPMNGLAAHIRGKQGPSS